MNSGNKVVKRVVQSNDNGQRLDKFLTINDKTLSRSQWQKQIKNGNIEIDGTPSLSPKYKISTNELILIKKDDSQHSPLSIPIANDIPLDIIFEDDYILVINKPPNMVVHPGDGGEIDSVVNALLFKYANFADNFDEKQRPGIVHRLDKDTSGTLIIAKNQEILTTLSNSFKNRTVEKTYLALVHGSPKKTFATIDLSIGRHPVNRKKMAVSESGKNAISHYNVEKQGYIDNNIVSLLKVKIDTGRTHQIRVHLSHLHLPVIGDTLYGGSKRLPHVDRQMLHANTLKINHPISNKEMTFSSPIPEDFATLSLQLK